MDIAAMSMQLSSAKLQQSASLSFTKKAMNNQEAQAADLLKMMDAAAPNQIKATGLGQYVDVRV